MNLNYKILINIFIVLLGLLFIFWNRLIRERFPKDLIRHSFDYEHIIIGALVLCFLILSMYHLYKFYRIYKPRHNANFIITRFKNKILNFMDNNKFIKYTVENYIELVIKAPYIVFETIIYAYIPLKNFIWTYGVYLAKFCHTDNFTYGYFLIYVIGYELFRFVVLFIFFIEVCFFQHIEYFYKFLPLLLIPLILKIILHTLYFGSRSNKSILESYLEFKQEPNKTLTIALKPEYDDENLELEYVVFLWENYRAIYETVDTIYTYRDNLKCITNIFYYFIYFLTFSFYFIFIF